jgi:hypothetical protein
LELLCDFEEKSREVEGEKEKFHSHLKQKPAAAFAPKLVQSRRKSESDSYVLENLPTLIHYRMLGKDQARASV